MNDVFLPNLIKTIKITLISSIIFFLFIYIFLIKFYSSYDKNIFQIKFNDIDMNCYYSEQYNNMFIVSASSSGYNSVEKNVNEVELKDDMSLVIDEYEVYYKNNYKKNNNFNWFFDANLIYNKTNNNVINIKIYRMNKKIYDGTLLDNYNEIIDEPGRYYFHIYNKRKINILSSVNTHISFNVIIGGGNYEEKN